MPETESRKGIIEAIKSPLGITALIVLVGEALTFFAMRSTPKDDPFYRWYFIIMIGLLVLLIPGYYIFILKSKNGGVQTQSIVVEGQVLSAAPAKDGQPKTMGGDVFTDSNFGFSLVVPPNCSRSGSLSYKSYLQQLAIINTDDEYIPVQNNIRNTQFGELYLNSTSYVFQIGDFSTVHFTKDTSTDAMEAQLKRWITVQEANGAKPTDEEISDRRHEMNFGNSTVEKINSGSTFSITIMPKKSADGYGITPNLANVFLVMTIISPQLMDELVANDQSILWKTSNKLLNAQINNKVTDVIIYRIERLVQNKENFFLLSIQWSPQIAPAYEVWNSLQKMFESFRIS